MRSHVILALAITAAACSKEATTSANTKTPLLSLVASTSAEDDVKWGPAPAIFPKGAQFAVMQGDPSTPNEFTVRLRFPNGYKLPAHMHPTIENVTVLTSRRHYSG